MTKRVGGDRRSAHGQGILGVSVLCRWEAGGRVNYHVGWTPNPVFQRQHMSTPMQDAIASSRSARGGGQLEAGPTWTCWRVDGRVDRDAMLGQAGEGSGPEKDCTCRLALLFVAQGFCYAGPYRGEGEGEGGAEAGMEVGMGHGRSVAHDFGAVAGRALTLTLFASAPLLGTPLPDPCPAPALHPSEQGLECAGKKEKKKKDEKKEENTGTRTWRL